MSDSSNLLSRDPYYCPDLRIEDCGDPPLFVWDLLNIDYVWAGHQKLQQASWSSC